MAGRRPKNTTDKVKEKIYTYRRRGCTVADISNLTRLSRATVHRILKANNMTEDCPRRLPLKEYVGPGPQDGRGRCSVCGVDVVFPCVKCRTDAFTNAKQVRKWSLEDKEAKEAQDDDNS